MQLQENTMLINADKYIQMKTLFDKLKNGGGYYIDYDGYFVYVEYNAIIDGLAKDLESARRKNRELEEKVGKPFYKYNYSHTDDIKDWSMFEFLKNRRRFRKEFKQRLIKAAKNLAK